MCSVLVAASIVAAVAVAEDASAGICPWYNNVMCVNSEGACQPCNQSPWYDTDGGRCVCGPGANDWIHENECRTCGAEAKKEKVEASAGSCPWYSNVMCG